MNVSLKLEADANSWTVMSISICPATKSAIMLLPDKLSKYDLQDETNARRVRARRAAETSNRNSVFRHWDQQTMDGSICAQ